METIIDTFSSYLNFVSILVGLLTPLLILLLPTFAFIRWKKWRWGVVLQALASLIIWAGLSFVIFIILYFYFLATGFSENVSESDERISKLFEIVLGLIYTLINVALVGGLLFGIQLQVGRRNSDDPSGAI